MSPKERVMIFKGRDLMRQSDNQTRGQGAINSNITALATSNNTVKSEQQEPMADDLTNGNDSASSHFGYQGNNSNKKQKMGSLRSFNRWVGQLTSVPNEATDYSLQARAEIDTRADTICPGATFVMLEPTGKLVDVEGFHQSMEPVRNIPVAMTETALDLESETVILECPQSLFFGNTMENSLIPPAQLWDPGLTVDVVPPQYSDG
jgi:hypothetical protein